jgi:AcrR family transcriptional regulator
MHAMSKPVKTRSYHSPARAAQAEQTRQRVIGAATCLFLEVGYPKSTLGAIGERAGVAADTVLHLFGSKHGLLKSVMDVMVGGDDADMALLDRADPQALRREPDPNVQVAMFATGISAQLERVRPMDDILRGAAMVDADAAELRADLQLRQRRQAMLTLAGWIADNGPLRGGRSVEDAGAVLWTLTSSEVHRMLREDMGWSSDAYRAWLADTLTRTLLPDR